MSENELKEYIEKIGTSFEQFKASYDKKIYDLETIVARGAFPGGSGGTGAISPAQSEYGKKFVAWFRSGKGEDDLRGMAPRAEWSTQSDPDGGFLVPEQLDKQIDRLAIDSVAMRRIATVKPGLRGDYKRPFSKGGATGGWVGETETRTETSTPDLALFSPRGPNSTHCPRSHKAFWTIPISTLKAGCWRNCSELKPRWKVRPSLLAMG